MKRASRSLAMVVPVMLSCAHTPTHQPKATSVARPAPPRSIGDPTIVHLPTGADITPLAAPGSSITELDPKRTDYPALRAGYAMSLALSPDGCTLALLTSGYNTLEDEHHRTIVKSRAEYVFFYDVSAGKAVEKQVVALPNAFVGLAFAGSGDRLYVSGGSDDSVHVLEQGAEGTWSDVRVVRLGHDKGLGLNQGPLTAGLAVALNGDMVAVANHENDSLSVLDERKNTVFEVDLRPGGGVAGGEFPLGVATVGGFAYVTAQRDRELVEVDLGQRRVTRRLVVGGPPVRVIASRDETRLYVSSANSDEIVVVDRVRFVVLERIPVGGPPGSAAASLRGASPNAIAVGPDDRLYVSLGGANAIATVEKNRLVGLVPTGFYPNDVVVSHDGRTVFAAFGKSVSGPTDGVQSPLEAMRGGLHTIPLPDAPTLALLTTRALQNEHTEAPPSVSPVFEALRGKVRHVIYVVAENRTFDQILGDVPSLDGDPKLVHWGAAITPNQHLLATKFSGFDRFYDSGGVSGDGWQWSTAALTTDVAEKEIPLVYANRGKHSYDWEGKNRGVDVSREGVAARKEANSHTPDDPDLLPGVADVAAVDRPREGGRGYLWDVVKSAGLHVRNYGFFIDDATGDTTVRQPFDAGVRIAWSNALGLEGDTDPYFRGFDMAYPDYWRAREWQRELHLFEAAGSMPELVMVRLPRDHLGSFARSFDGVNTPDTQMADHDYALGMMIESLSRSRFWQDTVVIALEDDAQDGADHVDSHRSVLFFAGGHAARGVVSHRAYTTVNVLKTIEVLLGLPPLSRRDAVASPIAEAFTADLDTRGFDAQVPDVLRSTTLPLPPPTPTEHVALPRGDVRSWSRATASMRFDREDHNDAQAFNALLLRELHIGSR